MSPLPSGQHSDAIESQLVCSSCVGEKHLQHEMEITGADATCHYCGEPGKCWTVEQLTDRVDKAFEQHYEQTAANPEGVEATMANDPESSYEWERSGQQSADAIAEAAGVSEEIAEDVREVLSDRHFDRSSAEVGDEQAFDADTHYAKKEITGAPYQEDWNQFERTVREESRYFAPVVRSTLDRIFDGVAGHKTISGHTVVADAGPSTKIDHLFRARVFQSERAVLEAIERPDLRLGPPPPNRATAGRMNPAGISVFYGARSTKVATAEVRPPVGSRVVSGKFEITRSLKLLNLDALVDVYVKGSIFDPNHAGRMERAAFLGTLGFLLCRAVMPEEETSGYLVTQVVADYLANVVKLDGVIFRSVQTGTKSANVVLFHHASRVEKLDLPEGSKISAVGGMMGPDEDDADYYVGEEVPEIVPPKREGHGVKISGMGVFEFWGSSEPVDPRPVTLRLETKSVQVTHIAKVEYSGRSFEVHRYRTTKPAAGEKPPF